MRNADAVTAISAKVGAHISEITGTHVPAITAEQIEQDIANGDGPLFLAYTKALPTLNPFAGPGDIEHTITRLALYAQDSARPLTQTHPVYRHEEGLTAEEIAALREDEQLDHIPREFWPDAPDGTPRTNDAMHAADDELQVAYDHEPETAPHLRKYQLRTRRQLAARYLPADFTQEGEGSAADAERELAAWGAMRASRDEIVRRALAAGVTKTRIHEITGISRATIDRIPSI